MSEVELIHIHEDDWGLRNLYPLAALAETAADMRRAASAAERNRAPDGGGWTSLHLIRAPDGASARFDIPVQAVAAALAAILPRVRRFHATASAGFEAGARDAYGRYDDDPICYGFDAGCYLKVEADRGVVTAIWYECNTDDRARLRRLREAFRAIDGLVPCVLADYVLDVVGPIGDAAFLDRYFGLFAPAPTAGVLSRLRAAVNAWFARIKGE